MSTPGERYPGMKALATRLFAECPRAKHGELSRQMKFYLDSAKAQGTATSMDWNSQSLYTLKKMFGPPPKIDGPASTNKKSSGSTKASLGGPGAGTTLSSGDTNSRSSSSLGNPPTSGFPSRSPSGPSHDHGFGSNSHNQSFGAPHNQSFGSNSHNQSIFHNRNVSSASVGSASLGSPGNQGLAGFGNQGRAGFGNQGRAGFGNQGLADVRSPGNTTFSRPKNSTNPSRDKSPVDRGRKRKLSQPLLANPGPAPPTKATAELRRQRFGTGGPGKAALYKEAPIVGTIVGTSQDLEKPFFRLTGQVNPAVVRPPAVLARALAHVLQQYRAGKGYGYVSSQLQSIRQDLTVQHVETALTVEVYETNARIALFHDDLGEFNKCLTRLTDLYGRCADAGAHRGEFRAYAVYYTLLRRKWDELSAVLQTVDARPGPAPDRPDAGGLAHLDPARPLYPEAAADQDEMLARALTAIHRIQQQDLFGLMADHRAAWPLEKKLLDRTVQREQARALEGVLVATRPQRQVVPLPQIRRWLGLASDRQLEALLTAWAVPFAEAGVASDEALPAVQRASQRLGGLDIKGQI